MLTQTVSVSKTGALILARLLTAPARLSPATLRKNLDPFFRGRDAEAWQALFNETTAQLERDGLIARRPLALTEAGRAQALEFLGLETLPEGTTWPQIKSRYLVAAALGVPRADEAGRTRLGKAEGLRVAILQSRYELSGVETMTQALDALVRKALEMDPTEKITLGALKARVLGRFLKLLANPDLKEFKAQLPVDAVKATRNTTDELRAAVLRDWLADERVSEAPTGDEENVPAAEAENVSADGTPRAGEASDSRPAEADVVAPAAEGSALALAEVVAPSPPAFDLAAFADRVQDAASASESGRFGDNKVFISHVWRSLRHDTDFSDMTEAEFKKHLTEANHRGLLRLSRADLVEVMDPADVRESETPYLHAVFHFIQI